MKAQHNSQNLLILILSLKFDNKIYHVGKHMNYIEFEELLNK